MPGGEFAISSIQKIAPFTLLVEDVSLSKKIPDVSGLTRPWLYAVGRADSDLLFSQIFQTIRRKKEFLG